MNYLKYIIPSIMALAISCKDGETNKTSEKLDTAKYHKDPVTYAHSALQEIPFQHVQVKSDFWSPRIETIADSTLPLVWELAKKQGRMENFKIVAGESNDKYHIRNSPDAPVYKLIEAGAYTFSEYENKPLEAAMDSLIALAAQIQQPDGYVHTQFMLPDDSPQAPTKQKAIKTFGFGKDQQWKSSYKSWPKGYSQLFTAGHMFEAAVAYYRGTGKTPLLDVSIKLADLLVKKFKDVDFAAQYADHPEVEIGLMKLYEVTGNEAYARTADRIGRHVKFGRPPDLHKDENLLPLSEQKNAYGHAVRTAYLYSGATDVVRALGDRDLKNTMFDLWESVASKKMYIHGGTGNGTAAEQHGLDYELPIYPTYSEGCANVAQGEWNHRMNLLTGDAGYSDLVELEMYNAALAGISLNGKQFFYSNKINVGLEDRKGKFGGVRETYFFCCPSKLPSFVSGVSRWMYAKDSTGIYVNQYIGGDLETELNGNELGFSLKTEYPYDGKVTFTVKKGTQQFYSLYFRVPNWVNGGGIFKEGLYYFGDDTPADFTVSINGTGIDDPKLKNGYVSLRQNWKAGDQVTIDFEMPVRRVYTDSKDKYNSGRVALMRGPLLFALEGVDNDFDVSKFVLPKDNIVKAEWDHSILNGTMTLTGNGKVGNKKVDFKAIPYNLWQNRGIYKMSLLMIEDPNNLYEQTHDLKTKLNTNG